MYAIVAISQKQCASGVCADVIPFDKVAIAGDENPVAVARVARDDVASPGGRPADGVSGAIEFNASTVVSQGVGTLEIGADEVALDDVTRVTEFMDADAEAGDVEPLHRTPAAGELEPVAANVRAIELNQDRSVVALSQRVGGAPGWE